MPLVFEISCDIPSEFYPGRCEGFEEYITLKEQTCYDYRHPPDPRRLYVEGQRSIRENTPEVIMYGLQIDDGPLMLEFCLRMLSVCNPPVGSGINPMRIAERLAGFKPHLTYSTVDNPGVDLEFSDDEDEDPSPPPNLRNTTTRTRLQALACYAHMFFFSCWADDKRALSWHGNRQMSYALYYACCAANFCISHGFVPIVAIRIASWLATTRARYGLDVRTAREFCDLRHLWNAHSSYLSRLQVKETARLKKTKKAPHHYRCAHNGCEIQATNKSSLLKCGGACPPERKPRYCSASCQRQHWYIHREFCKPDNTNDYPTIIDDDGEPDWIEVDDFHPPTTGNVSVPPWSAEWDLFADGEGREIFIDIPNDSPFRKGEIWRVKTCTLSPTCLKAYRAVWNQAKAAAKAKMRTFVNKVMTHPPENMGFPGGPEPRQLGPW
ncbi:hypothetical protein VTO73DRAFT_11833 [Trametes versicolor]